MDTPMPACDREGTTVVAESSGRPSCAAPFTDCPKSISYSAIVKPGGGKRDSRAYCRLKARLPPYRLLELCLFIAATRSSRRQWTTDLIQGFLCRVANRLVTIP